MVHTIIPVFCFPFPKLQTVRNRSVVDIIDSAHKRGEKCETVFAHSLFLLIFHHFAQVPISTHRCDGPELSVETSKEELLHMFKEMSRIRRTETEADKLYKAKHIKGFLHLYSGQVSCCLLFLVLCLLPFLNAVCMFPLFGHCRKLLPLVWKLVLRGKITLSQLTVTTDT